MTAIRKLEIRVDQTGTATKGMKGLAAGLKGIAVPVGIAVGAIAGLGAAALTVGAKLSGLGADAEEMIAKFDVVFGKSAPGATAELEKFGDAVGRNKFDLMEMASTVQDTFVPLGFARDEAAEMSVGLTKLAVDVGSFNNKLAPDVMKDFQSAIVGNTETVRKYGIVINQGRIESKALEMGLIEMKVSQVDVELATSKVALAQAKYNELMADDESKESSRIKAKENLIKAENALASALSGEAEELTETGKAQAIMQIITESTTDAQGDALETTGSWTNQMLAMKESITEGATEMGLMLNEALLPLLSEFVPWIQELVPQAVEVFKEFAANLGETVGPAMVMIKDAIDRISVAFGIEAEAVSAIDIILWIFKATLDTIVTAMQLVALGAQAVAWAIEQIKKPIDNIIKAFDTLKEVAKSALDSLPDWIKPGSPTPFEIGLRGIADAAKRVNLEIGGMGMAPMAGAGVIGGGGGAGITVNLTYSPAVSLANRAEAQQQLGPYIAEYLRKQGY